MNPRLRIALALGVLLLAFAAFALLQRERDPAPAALPSGPAATPAERAPDPQTGSTTAAVATPPASERVPSAPQREAVPDTATAAQPQGLRGRAIDGDGRALPGLPVYLAESASNEPFSSDLVLQQRHAFAPLATTSTAADGTFAIGLPVAQTKVYELYIVSPHHATARVGGLRLLPAEWHDLGPITLVPGAVLRGRVTVAGRSDIPVPQATITVEIGSAFADAALRGLPGTTPGLLATSAPDGSYELHHVPSRGVVQVSAVAPGFARVLRSDIQLARDEPTVVDFGLPPGLTIAGVVVDTGGQPIRDARIEAWPTKAAGSALIARSDARGAFVVMGLVEGPYRVRAGAPGFETWQQAEVVAGQPDLRCVLAVRSTASVRVTTPAGQVVRSYRLAIRRWFPEHGGRIGALPNLPDRQVRLDGLTDRIEVPDLPSGRLVCEVEAEGFAKTLSAEFDNTARPDAPLPRRHDVEVVLEVGSTLFGAVVDDAGQPLAGATVQTMTDGALPDNPLQQMLAGAIPERITGQRATARADGTFVLRQLARGRYQLLVEHPDACRTTVAGLDLEAPSDRQLPPIRMPRGALVQGRITRGGSPIVGQAKVVLTSTAGAGREALRLEATTDAAGAFTMPRRVPPGNYELRAAVLGTTEPEAQIFQQLLQLQRSSTTVSIAPGESLVQRDLDLPTER